MRSFCAAFFLLIFFSCNTKDKQPVTTAPPTATDTASQEKALQAAVKQYPDSLPLLENLLGYYSDSENYPKAMFYIRQAISKDSTNPALWDMQSVIQVAQSDTAGAIRSLENAVTLYPDQRYMISLGSLYAETKNAKALSITDAMLAADKSHALKEAYFIKGLYYSFANMKEKAIPFFDMALDKDYQFMNAYLEKALALYDLKKYQEAADVLIKAVTLQNNFDVGYYYLGQCYEKLNRKDDAANAYRKALMYDPDYEEAADALDRLSQ
jgi:tetratricopeptide (TPR) repeat protein